MGKRSNKSNGGLSLCRGEGYYCTVRNIVSRLLLIIFHPSAGTTNENNGISSSSAPSPPSCSCYMSKRRRHFPLLLLGIMSAVACGLYYATYFQAVTTTSWHWKSGQWFGLLPRSSAVGSNNTSPASSNANNNNNNVMKRFPHVKQQNNRPPSSSSSSPSSPSHENSTSLSGKGISRFLDEMEDELSLEQISCKLPKLDPMDSSIIEFIKPPPDIDCADDSHPSIFRTDFHSNLIQMKVFQQPVECCYKTLQRGNFSDKEIKFSRECFRVKSSEQRIPAEHEFIYIRCKNSSLSPANHTKQETIIFKDMFAFVPVKPQVEARVAMYERKYADSNRMETTTMMTTTTMKSPNDSSRRVSKKYSKSAEKKKSRRNAGGSKSKSKSASRSSSSSSSSSGRKGSIPTKEERLELEDRLSIVILGLDAQSHMNLIRQMPLSYDYLVHNLSAIGLHGYTKVSDNTFPNVVPILTGLSVSELKKACWNYRDSHFDDCPFIWKSYASRGYRTSFAEDSVWMGTFNYNKAGFLKQPTDYYLNPFTYLMAKKIGHETWGNAEICYGPRLGFEVLLEYLVKTAFTFGGGQPGKRYFQFIWATSLFHDYLNNPKLGDRLLSLTLELLHTNHFLNQTLFILLSDHGIRWGGIRSTYQGKIEERMPLAYFVFPPWFHTKYPHLIRSLKLNSKRLTTPFDIHELLKDMLYLNTTERREYHHHHHRQHPPPPPSSLKFPKSPADPSISPPPAAAPKKTDQKSSSPEPSLPRGLSLFHPIPLTRTCNHAEISDHWCVCNAMVTTSNNTSTVKSAANFIVNQINEMLSALSEYCAKLELVQINEAFKTIEYNSQSSAPTNSPPPSLTLTDDALGRDPTDKTNFYNGPQLKDTSSLMDHRQQNNCSSPSASSPCPTTTTASPNTNDNQREEAAAAPTKSHRIQLQLTVLTQPGHGIFEATVAGSATTTAPPRAPDSEPHYQWQLSGDISRISRYGSQSSCISNFILQKFCYCLEILEGEAGLL